MKQSVFLFVLVVLLCKEQGAQAQGNTSSASLPGIVNIPALMSIDVTAINSAENIILNKFDDFENGRVINNFIKVEVKSNRPWMVNIVANDQFATYSKGPTNMPVGIFSLRQSNSQAGYVPLAGVPQLLLQSSNNDIVNDYFFDLKIKPLYGRKGGNYTANMTFVLTPQ